MALTVSYFNPKDLMQLSSTYRKNLYEQLPDTAVTEQRSPQLPSVIGNQASAGDSITEERNTYVDKNLGEIGKVEHDQKRQATSSNRSPEQSSSKPLGIISIAHDRYSYTRNCPTRFNDPTGHTECDLGEAIVGGGLAVVFGIMTYIAVAATAISIGTLQIELAGLGALITSFTGGLTFIGGWMVFDSGCIPGIPGNH
jgi:hypothetical protein